MKKTRVFLDRQELIYSDSSKNTINVFLVEFARLAALLVAVPGLEVWHRLVHVRRVQQVTQGAQRVRGPRLTEPHVRLAPQELRVQPLVVQEHL